mmetsp:Transcript_22652/g.49602  ORF Transcript_22652/g.49602 Transcript_22652/m.49602 type:complete len:117 (+) Transcript_22652:2834-3184(+)
MVARVVEAVGVEAVVTCLMPLAVDVVMDPVVALLAAMGAVPVVLVLLAQDLQELASRCHLQLLPLLLYLLPLQQQQQLQVGQSPPHREAAVAGVVAAQDEVDVVAPGHLRQAVGPL